jgi:2'-5' RNA ligase
MPDTGLMPPSQSALIVPIPEAEPAVGDHRARFDTAASWGIPAHITVFYPFLQPSIIDTTVLSALQDIFWTVPRFTLRLTRIGWFGDKVLWLKPDPDGPVRALTAAVSKTFGLLPYAGEHAEPTPHLTVAHDHPLTTLRRTATEVQRHLPIPATVDRVQLIAGRPEPGRTWQTLTEFTLA